MQMPFPARRQETSRSRGKRTPVPETAFLMSLLDKRGFHACKPLLRGQRWIGAPSACARRGRHMWSQALCHHDDHPQCLPSVSDSLCQSFALRKFFGTQSSEHKAEVLLIDPKKMRCSSFWFAPSTFASLLELRAHISESNPRALRSKDR